MELQTALSRLTVLLLFLYLSLGCYCHPLSTPIQASEHTSMQANQSLQKVLDQLSDKMVVTQAEKRVQERLQQNQDPTVAQETKTAAPAPKGVRKTQVGVLQRPSNPKTMRNLGCFGGKLDRIGSFSGLGCNVLRKH